MTCIGCGLRGHYQKHCPSKAFWLQSFVGNAPFHQSSYEGTGEQKNAEEHCNRWNYGACVPGFLCKSGRQHCCIIPRCKEMHQCFHPFIALDANDFVSCLSRITPLEPLAFRKIFLCTSSRYSSQISCIRYCSTQKLHIAVKNSTCHTWSERKNSNECVGQIRAIIRLMHNIKALSSPLFSNFVVLLLEVWAVSNAKLRVIMGLSKPTISYVKSFSLSYCGVNNVVRLSSGY